MQGPWNLPPPAPRLLNEGRNGLTPRSPGRDGCHERVHARDRQGPDHPECGDAAPEAADGCADEGRRTTFPAEAGLTTTQMNASTPTTAPPTGTAGGRGGSRCGGVHLSCGQACFGWESSPAALIRTAICCFRRSISAFGMVRTLPVPGVDTLMAAVPPRRSRCKPVPTFIQQAWGGRRKVPRSLHERAFRHGS